MDIRKFFGVGPNVKTSEKPGKTISNSTGSTSSKPVNKPSTSKKSPRSPAKSRARFSNSDVQISVQAKNKTGLKDRPDDKIKDSDRDDFSKELIHPKTVAKRKKETGDEVAGKPKAFSEETAEIKKSKKQKVKESKYEEFHNNNNGASALSKSKSVSSPTKKRKRTLDQSFDKSSAEEEEAPIAKRNPAPRSATHRAVIFDSDSDEDPLPKAGVRRGSSLKKPPKQHSEDEEKPTLPIVSAFGKTHPKTTAISNQVSSTSVVKQPVNATDFFGAAPIQRKETCFVGKVEDMITDAKADVIPSNEGNLKKSCAEVNYLSGVRLSEKLAVKKKEFDNRESSKTMSDDQRSVHADVTHINTSARKSQRLSPQKTSKVASPAAKTPDPVKKGSHNEMAGGSSEKGQMQKKGSAYLAYKNREPPKALGAKEIPQGAENCLEGLTFVITGVLESIERDEAKCLVERHGGKVMQNVSKNTKYLVVGREAGEAKISKAQQLGTTQLDEDGLFALVRTLPGKKSKYELAAASEKAPRKTSPHVSVKPPTVASSSALVSTTPESQRSDVLTQSSQQALSPKASADDAEALMWVDRYKPTSSKQIIGQQGDKSNAKKLSNWLTAWHKNLGKKPVFGRTSDDGAGYKAALLSGPPGVGKTTTAQIICQEAGVSFIELNASDTRSKRSLKEEVSEALNNHTLVDFFLGTKGFQSGSIRVDGQKHCLVMDEVDGMAGNEDRGGMQELIQLIKQTKIPIICMCNDRNHPKIRSLSNYCFDLRFQRPRAEQIKGAMMSIAYKEGLKIPPPALNDIIQAANQDIRQILHNLSMWTIKDKTLSYEQLKQEAKKAQKDLHLGPFDVCRKVFVGGEETSKMTLNDKSDLFFHDYSIGPLFVQENYIHVTPFQSQGNCLKHLQCLSRAADSIAIGDLVDGFVRRGGRWNLLPTQAIFASVIPGEKMRGTVGQMIQFPSWLGKNSTTSKNDRLHQELRTHMRLNISANKKALGQEYLPALRTMLTSPLINEGSDGVGKVVSILDAYDLLREDFDSVIELTSWTGMKDPMSQIDSKVKAAFTRAYNKEAHLTPYATVAVAKKGRGRGESANQEDYELETGEDSPAAAAVEESEHSGDEDIATDSMIKTKKTSSKGTKGISVEQNKNGGRGKGKGKNSKKSV